jgi:TolB protein
MMRRRYGSRALLAQLAVVAGLGCGGALDKSGPRISIDAWIAFDSDEGGNRNVFVIRADGSGRRRLTNESSFDAQPSFSPDGTKLAFTSDRGASHLQQIYVMDLATGVATPVTQRPAGAHDAAFSLDGARLAYRSGVSVFTANLDGTDDRQVTDCMTCSSGPCGGPVFASDGQSLIYDDYNASYSVSDGSTVRRAIDMPTTGEQSHPALSPDGSSLVLQATCGGDDAARSIWIVPAGATTSYTCSEGRRISPRGVDATNASWGPDFAIVWGAVTGGNNTSSPVPSALAIWQDGTEGALTGGDADDRNPSWSPLGTVIGTW